MERLELCVGGGQRKHHHLVYGRSNSFRPRKCSPHTQAAVQATTAWHQDICGLWYSMAVCCMYKSPEDEAWTVSSGETRWPHRAQAVWGPLSQTKGQDLPGDGRQQH